MEPVVSVIVPTFNGRRHIGETLDSVLAQTYRSLQVIVVDDGSTDGSPELVATYAPRVRLIRQPNAGHPAARNLGLRAATGEFLSFIDHDDLWSPTKIESQLQCFHLDPTLDLVFGHIQNFFTPELTPGERSLIAAPMGPVRGPLQGTMLARRSAFDRVGPFSEERDMGDFLNWYGRALILDLKMHMQSAVVLRRRIHAANFQRTHRHLRSQYLAAIKELMDLRRAAGTRN